MTLLKTPSNEGYGPQPAIFCNQARPSSVVGLGDQSGLKTFDLQSILSATYAGGNGDTELVRMADTLKPTS